MLADWWYRDLFQTMKEGDLKMRSFLLVLLAITFSFVSCSQIMTRKDVRFQDVKTDPGYQRYIEALRLEIERDPTGPKAIKLMFELSNLLWELVPWEPPFAKFAPEYRKDMQQAWWELRRNPRIGFQTHYPVIEPRGPSTQDTGYFYLESLKKKYKEVLPLEDGLSDHYVEMFSTLERIIQVADPESEEAREARRRIPRRHLRLHFVYGRGIASRYELERALATASVEDLDILFDITEEYKGFVSANDIFALPKEDTSMLYELYGLIEEKAREKHNFEIIEKINRSKREVMYLEKRMLR